MLNKSVFIDPSYLKVILDVPAIQEPFLDVPCVKYCDLGCACYSRAFSWWSICHVFVTFFDSG